MKYKSVYAVHHLSHLLGDIEILVDEADELYYCNESSGEYIRIVLEEIKVK